MSSKFSLENEVLKPSLIDPSLKIDLWENVHDFVASGGCCQPTDQLL
jgi:hypothetical protein